MGGHVREMGTGGEERSKSEMGMELSKGATDQPERGPSVPALIRFCRHLGRRKGVGCRGVVLEGCKGEGMIWQSTVMRQTGSKSPHTRLGQPNLCGSLALVSWNPGR
jgi:hypothetical protein